MAEQLQAVERRRRNLRIILFGIILATLPFYCLGFILFGTAPRGDSNDQTPSPTATFTPIGQDITNTPTLRPSITPLATTTSTSPLLPTPFQFLPPPPTATFTEAAVVIPTFTLAPTLTPPPAQPTATPVPALPTNTPIPLPTNTPVPLPTNTPESQPTATPIPAPTDTPIPPPTDTLTPTTEAPGNSGDAPGQGGNPGGGSP